jgi:hypothetical protein
MSETIDYRAVLDDLKTRRAALDQAIAAVEAILGESPTASVPLNVRTSNRSAAIQHDTFVGLNILDATVRYLEIVGRPARSTEEIAGALTSGGISATQGSVATILSRSHNSPNGTVRRAGRGTWGLPEWYAAGARRTNREEGA